MTLGDRTPRRRKSAKRARDAKEAPSRKSLGHAFIPADPPQAKRRSLPRPATALPWLLAGLLLITLVILVIAPQVVIRAEPGGEASNVAAESNVFRSLALQALAGIFLLLGAYQAGRTLDLNRKAQIASRYSSAVTQLGDESEEIRVGGVYALETIARDSAVDREAVLNVLVALVRRSGSRERTDNDDLPEDIEAAMRVLGRIPRANGDTRLLRLAGADLRHGRFEGLDFSYTDLRHCDEIT